jgi:hypothetical protein
MIPILLLPIAAGGGDILFSEVVKWILALVVLFGGPVIKSALDRARAKGDRGEDLRRAAREREREGRRAFEELMRGGTAAPAPPPIPIVPPAEPATRAPSRSTPERTLTELEGIPAQPLSGPELDAEEGLPESELPARVQRREREELDRQREELRRPERIAREEYAAASSARTDVEPVPVEVFRAPTLEPAASMPSSEAARRLLGGGTERRSALRRAFVLNEVLGRPVAAPDRESQPAGWRA